MTRPLRIEYENAFYHVMNRGKGRQKVFHDDDYYQAFLQCLEEAHKRFGVEIHAYCLMSNHYHLLVKTPRSNLSRVMRHINGVYTQRHNRLKQSDGSLFRGRYKATVVDASNYLLQVGRYIHRNPIETKVPLVESLEDYYWSSYGAYINKGPVPAWLNRDSTYGELASAHRYKAYRIFVAQGNDPKTVAFYQTNQRASVFGETDFIDQIKHKLTTMDKETDQKGIVQPVKRTKIIEAVAKYYQIARGDIIRTKRGKGLKNIPRWVAMKLCQEVGSEKLADIAEAFNVSHYSTVSQAIGRLNKLMLADPHVKNDYNMLSQDLTP